MNNAIKIGVIGANGQLGTDLCTFFNKLGFEIIELNHNNLDITDFQKCKEVLSNINVKFVINTAAMHNVESCEDNPVKSFSVNGLGARNLAILSKDLDYTLIHFSTDYVFNGYNTRPYIEGDTPLPLNVYGNTKLAGENFIRSIAEKYFILRISGIYGRNQCRAKSGLNFVTLMLKLASERDEIRVVNNERLSPTHTIDICKQLKLLISQESYGLYHVATLESCSWYEFAKKIFELKNIKTKLSIANPDEFPVKVPRPLYSVLDNSHLNKIGINIMPHWETSLEEFLNL